MQNKNYDHGLELVPSAATDPFYPKFVAVISQFESTVISQNILRVMKDY